MGWGDVDRIVALDMRVTSAGRIMHALIVIVVNLFPQPIPELHSRQVVALARELLLLVTVLIIGARTGIFPLNCLLTRSPCIQGYVKVVFRNQLSGLIQKAVLIPAVCCVAFPPTIFQFFPMTLMMVHCLY